ncbi:MAG TPA: amidohydrolase family protein [Xanthomonadaceae bacterium]|jgi:imidazolonepropionase-like amidohydrolase|nr:amidohydrolase family protein [Xanthomonadaceae bacterium]
MNRPLRRALALAAVLAVLPPAVIAAQPPAPGASAALVPTLIVLQSPRVLLDPADGRIAAATIIVEGDRILRVLEGTPETLPDDLAARVKQRIVTEDTLMPGLIDSHVHLTGNPAPAFWAATVTTPERATATGVANALKTVRAGFTTVRDLGAPGGASYALRDAINAGEVPGPRILAAGRMLSIVGGHADLTGFRPQVIEALDGGNTCTGEVQCAEVVRRLSRAGADVIKFAATGGVLSQQNRGLDQHFTDAEMKAIVTTAHLLGLRVAAHAHGPRGIEAAARAGVDSIDHGTYVDEAGIRAMKASGSVLVPTLSPTIAYRENLPRGLYTRVVEAKIRKRLEATGKNIAAAREAGLTIAFGTDAGVSEHGRNAEEMPLMVKYGGMSAQEVVVSATRTAATLLGLENEIGRIAPGFSADVIGVRGNPLEDLGALQRDRIGFVMARGTPVPMLE